MSARTRAARAREAGESRPSREGSEAGVPSAEHPVPLGRLWWSLGGFLALLTSIWVVLYVVWSAFPNIRPGFNQIYDMKEREVETGSIFPAHAKTRVIVFGNSRVLSGFIPDLFDELAGPGVYSYNLGLPDANRFVEELETLVARGQAPTHAVLTVTWSGKDTPSLLGYVKRDRLMISSLFPFRHVFRDALQFFVRARSRGGMAAFYATNGAVVEQARVDRGYYFIANESHYPNHRLPDDFRSESETPDVVWERKTSHRGPIFDRTMKLAREAGIRFIMAPSYCREGQFAPPAPNDAARAELAEHGIALVGPDYWTYPNAYFSDPTHVNDEGARIYTRALYEVTAPLIREDQERTASR